MASGGGCLIHYRERGVDLEQNNTIYLNSPWISEKHETQSSNELVQGYYS